MTASQLFALFGSSPDDAARIRCYAFETLLARVGARQQHQAVDHLRSTLRFREDLFQSLQILLRAAIPPLYGDLRGRPDQRHRSAQLVRRIGSELRDPAD